MIECINASFGYDGKEVVSELNFRVEKGDYLCIIGENGSGKSTLLKGILRLKSPMSGQLNIENGSAAGYLPQHDEIQSDFPASVYEVVLSGFSANLKGLFYSRVQRNNAVENLKQMGIYELKNKCFSCLSGGQKQRTLLARALCSAKDVLVLDEPAASLDPVATQELYSAVKEINKNGMTVIMVSHDVKTAIGNASHILHLGEKQMFFGKTEEYEKSGFLRTYTGGGCSE